MWAEIFTVMVGARAVLLPAVYVVLIVTQGRALAARPKAQAKLRQKLEPLRAILPHTPGEFRRFVPLCFTAGICEELLFRGYLVWVLQSWIGLWAAAGVSMVVFGLAHTYQGFQFGVRIAIHSSALPRRAASRRAATSATPARSKS